ncbi:hypothetical protein BGZ70_002411 [Mortierella alpina]|uniref:Uncharacterized protein n=1 Tax=Mortierella alpina TaxID=64518 RepID=A0A9P6IXC6_MORAP|nr:hypothetical protein BGZ70_002411 [Mortierella alpina]
MVLKTSFTMLVVATLAVFSSYTPQAEAHSWADCIDWKFNKKGKQDWSDQGGKCTGYARRFPLGKAFGSLDSNWPPRHYFQDGNNPNAAPPFRPHAKNHAQLSHANHTVHIYLSKARNGKDITQMELLKNNIANLNFRNCNVGPNEDRRPCGGCFKVPARAKGTYLLQWRWAGYASCADIQIK